MSDRKPQIAISKKAHDILTSRKYEMQAEEKRDVSYADVIDNLLKINEKMPKKAEVET